MSLPFPLPAHPSRCPPAPAVADSAAVLAEPERVGDAELVARSIAGDSLAFGTLYERYGQRVLRFAISRLGDVEEARDVVQETFVEALRGLSRYRGDAPVWSWLAGIAHHRICARYRARATVSLADAALTAELVWPAALVDDALDARRSLERCEAVLARAVSPAQRHIFHLRYGQNRSIASIARTVRRSRESVKVGLFRARRKLLREVPGLPSRAGA